MVKVTLGGAMLLSLALLGGCASQQGRQAVADAEASFLSVKEDTDVLRSAPKDVIRAGETLARAERLSSYWGSGQDVEHFAFLSQRYSQIARQHAELNLNQERLAKLELERERLQLALREAKLLSAQQQGQWLEEQVVSLAASETDRGLVMTLGDVLFDAGRTELKASANRTILKLVQFLQINPRRTVRIEGYTDNRGDARENLELSRARAQAVADLLTDLGIEGRRLEVVGYGEAHPLAENASAKGRAQNRRVEILISDEAGKLGAQR
ncbi:OmpA family protein [Pseudomonas alcaligenes]|uniref:OmpA family protein n=1 Tax=Aquipseudomonas alcaligenes TaxID=43263 RepID=UPI00358FE8D2